jgi:hypothetical protein
VARGRRVQSSADHLKDRMICGLDSCAPFCNKPSKGPDRFMPTVKHREFTVHDVYVSLRLNDDDFCTSCTLHMSLFDACIHA